MGTLLRILLGPVAATGLAEMAALEEILLLKFIDGLWPARSVPPYCLVKSTGKTMIKKNGTLLV